MDTILTTVFYNGQFWTALVEKITAGGQRYLARHVFGPEPSNTDLLHFYLHHYERLTFYESNETARIKLRRISEYGTKRSCEEYKRLQKQYLEEKKREKKKNRKEVEIERYDKKKEKKKRAKRGK